MCASAFVSMHICHVRNTYIPGDIRTYLLVLYGYTDQQQCHWVKIIMACATIVKMVTRYVCTLCRYNWLALSYVASLQLKQISCQ